MGWFSKDSKTPAELDAEFLAAVASHSLYRAQRALKKGADPHARDSEGNGAFHVLAAAESYETAMRVRALIDLLCAHDVPLNARNNTGETCLHRLFEHPHRGGFFSRGVMAEIALSYHIACRGSLMLDMLLNAGADCDAVDNQGRTPLHAACLQGDLELVSMCIGDREERLTVQDKDGFYPHDYTLRAQIDDRIALTVSVTKRFEACASKKNPAPVAPAAPMRDDSGWAKISETEIARIKTVDVIGYRLTEVFNFTDRLYMRVTHNIDTKAETAETRSFDDFADKKMFMDAREELLRRGGTVDESVIYRQRLNKPSS